jgi:chromosomal replication initiation ATPase DnaA
MTPMTPGESIVAERLQRAGLLELAIDVARRNYVDLVDVVGRDRRRPAAKARREFWGLIRWTLGLSYPHIAKLCSVDHTTVLAGVHLRERELEREAA